jgi:ribonuclease T2
MATGRIVTMAALAFALSQGPTAAQAQSFWRDLLYGRPAPAPCVLDKCLNPAKHPAPPATAGAAPSGDFDFYVLALSWSPGFCATGGAAKAPDQCADGAGLGFVVHGLWPQFQHGYPSDCDPGRPVSRIALDQTRGVYPSEGLARYEWRKHGTCAGLSPEAYFASAKAARDSIVIPDAFKSPRQAQSIAPADVQRAFSAANPGLRPEAMAIGCIRGELEEVRLCLSKDLRQFVACPEVARAACRSPAIDLAPVR